jgi:Flp pilus assembly protein TadG
MIGEDPMKRRLRFKAQTRRRGVSAVLLGVVLPVFVGLAALSVDLSVTAITQAQLQSAADAAALAGAMQLVDDYRTQGKTDLTNEINAANSSATQFAQANYVLGAAPVIIANSNNSSSGDIVVGYLDPNNITATLDTTSASESKYNAVQVTTSRNSSHGGLVPAYFSRILGNQGTDVTVTSTAIGQNFSINGFQTVDSGANANLLPIVLDQVTYNAMMAGTTQDQYTWNPKTQTVTSGPDGIAESVLYPVGSGSPGNWGTINVGVTNNSTSILNSQILYGITPAQLATFPNSTISLDYTQTPPQIIFSGNPGISAGIKSSLDAIIGKPVTIPIYDINGGNGNNAWYRVIAFQAVRILSVNFQGNPKYVIIQPANLNDPTAIPGTAQSSWAAGGVIEVYLAR